MEKEILRQYIKTTLEYGWAEAYEYKMNTPCTNPNTLFLGVEEVVCFEMFYAKTREVFIKKVLELDPHNIREDLIDEMKNDGYFEEDADVAIADLLEKIQFTEKYLPDTYIFSGEGYYDFWEWGDIHCERVDEILKYIEVEDKSKRDISDKYVEKNLNRILKKMSKGEI